MRSGGRRKSIAFFTILGVCLVAGVVTLNVGWIILNWRQAGLLVAGLIIFPLIITGVVLNTIFLVREIQSSLSGKQKTTLECLCWRNGMESVISTQFTVISRPCTFERFCKPHQIPILERTTSEPLKLVTDSIVADNDKTLRMYDASTAVYHPDGSTTVSTRSRQGSFLAKMTFDPVTSMPIHWTAGNCDRDSNSLDEVHYNAHPRFEKHKELYRIVSTEYNNPSPIGKISDAKSLGNCQFKWYQFNEDSIAFQNEKGTAFDLEEASEFLKATKLELTK